MLTGTAAEHNMTLSALVMLQGQVLNQTSAWWMHETQHIAPNALLAMPDPNVSIMRRCRVFPVEFVVRGYLTGTPHPRPIFEGLWRKAACTAASAHVAHLCSFPLRWVACRPCITI